MSVSATHPTYDGHLIRWQTVRDVVTSNVKAYIKDVEKAQDSARNVRYKDDARFTNFTGRTKNGLVGSAFRKEVEIDLPESIDYLEDDATGNQLSLAKLSQEMVGEVLQAGRYGLLTDFPLADEGDDIDNLKARFYRYNAESVINWGTSIIDGQFKLSLVTLREVKQFLGDDGFTWVFEKQYRVLRLIDGVYWQQLYNEAEELVSEHTPTDFNGALWDFIPFVFVGSEDNDVDVDVAPLLDLAQLNIGHLRNSADYEESVHITGQPTLVIVSEMSQEEFESHNPDGVTIGSRAGLKLGPGGSANMLQASPNQLADEAMRRKEEQAVMIGARLVTPISANETVDAVRVRSASETSVLSLVVANVNAALIQSLQYAQKFMSKEGMNSDDIIFKINTEFFDATLDPQALIAQLQLFNNGIIAKQDIRGSMRRAGLLDTDRTDEEIDSDVGDISPIL